MKNVDMKVDFIDVILIIVVISTFIGLFSIPVVMILGIWDLISGALTAKIIATAIIIFLVNMAITSIITEIY